MHGQGSRLLGLDGVVVTDVCGVGRDLPRRRAQPGRAARLEAFLSAVDRAGLPAFNAFAKGVRSWRSELLVYFDEPTINGYADGIISKVKVIKAAPTASPPSTRSGTGSS